ncbi:MAG: HEAT repeat domain-containing protein [Planctomycetes bacterium]|nr:HEAT repeat domain-containing protein [Planctomycetota bacterium]
MNSKPFIAVILALSTLLASCSYSNQLKQRDDRTMELEQKIAVLAKEAYDLNQRFNKQQKDMESLRFEMGVLRKELMEMRSPSLSPEQSQTERLTKLLQELANPSCDTNKLAFELRKFGKRSVLALIEALKKPDPDYHTRVELVFSGLLVDDATPLLLPSLKDLSLRISAARILGNLKNYSVVDELSGYLSGDDDDFIFAVAEALVKLKDKRGVPVLIDFLKKSDPNKRAIAFSLLSKIAGVTLDYKYYSNESELSSGTKRWEEWWLKNSPTFMFPPDD